MRDKLTAKQEHFAQLVASGSAYSEAYRQAYDVSPDASPVTAYVNSSKLTKHTKVALRIQELQAATEAALAAKRPWTTDRLVEEAEVNLIAAFRRLIWLSSDPSRGDTYSGWRWRHRHPSHAEHWRGNKRQRPWDRFEEIASDAELF